MFLFFPFIFIFYLFAINNSFLLINLKKASIVLTMKIHTVILTIVFVNFWFNFELLITFKIYIKLFFSLKNMNNRLRFCF